MNEIEIQNARIWNSLKGMRFQECCKDHCRDWHETLTGLPASNHSPSCPNYKLETFFKVCVKGTKAPYCILEKEAEVKDMCDTEDIEGEYDITKIEMTRDQFERLREFEGF